MCSRPLKPTKRASGLLAGVPPRGCSVSCPRGASTRAAINTAGNEPRGLFRGGDERGQVATAWVAAQKLRAIFRCGDRDHAAARLYDWTVFCIDSRRGGWLRVSRERTGV